MKCEHATESMIIEKVRKIRDLTQVAVKVEVKA